jgi:hypothetical protein
LVRLLAQLVDLPRRHPVHPAARGGVARKSVTMPGSFVPGDAMTTPAALKTGSDGAGATDYAARNTLRWGRSVAPRPSGGWARSRTCCQARLSRSTRRHQPRRDPQVEPRMRLKGLAAARVRYGYRLHVLLRRSSRVKLSKSLPRPEGLEPPTPRSVDRCRGTW